MDSMDRKERRRILSPHSQLELFENFKGYILDLESYNVFLVTNKNKELKLEPLAGAPERISGNIDLISTLKEYIQDSTGVKQFEMIDYSEYLQAYKSILYY